MCTLHTPAPGDGGLIKDDSSVLGGGRLARGTSSASGGVTIRTMTIHSALHQRCVHCTNLLQEVVDLIGEHPLHQNYLQRRQIYHCDTY